MFYARYIVLQVGKKEVPFLLSDSDVHGWERPRGNTMPYREKVLGAGFVTWNESDAASVRCFGAATMSLDSSRGTTRQVASRGEVDTALIQALLAQPLKYVILRLSGTDLPILGKQTSYQDDDHDGMVLTYQVYPAKCAVSAGEIDFGHGDKKPTRCYGDVTFRGYPPVPRPSRGAVDEAFFRAQLVRQMDDPQPPRSYRVF